MRAFPSQGRKAISPPAPPRPHRRSQSCSPHALSSLDPSGRVITPPYPIDYQTPIANLLAPLQVLSSSRKSPTSHPPIGIHENSLLATVSPFSVTFQWVKNHPQSRPKRGHALSFPTLSIWSSRFIMERIMSMC